MRRIVVLVVLLGLTASLPSAASTPIALRTLDGSGNNLAHPDWGQVGTQYLRVASPNYSDGIGRMVPGRPSRYVSNRVFNDVGQNLFSENGISQWGWTWGQFMDHTFGLRDERPGDRAPIAFTATDPLEQFTNDFGAIDFFRTLAATGTGETTPRQQINTVSSYIDGFSVYGGTDGRLEWLRRGPVDGTMANNHARLLLPGGYLPQVTERGDAASAPAMDLMGQLAAHPEQAIVAGDVRANENIALTALHTLFAREHNRIVDALPDGLSAEEKFQIARRIVGAEQQFITYNEFLPTLGVSLPPYRGYDPMVNASLSNEFAVVGYRAHSMIHGVFDVRAPASAYTPEELDSFREQGIVIVPDGDRLTLTIPLATAFGNPGLLRTVGLGHVLRSLSRERQYRNDEQIDNSLRSVLFQVPKPGIPDPSVCGAEVVNPDCFNGVVDLGAIDIERGRDHGMPYYNSLRQAYGLAPKTSFTAITGESTASFPTGLSIDDPSIMDFVSLFDGTGNPIAFGTPEAQEEAVTGIRRTTLAARLKAIYRTVDKVDAFVGMVSEPHVAGTEFGQLQLAIWKKQFKALRDGDRFFYANDPVLTTIKAQFGIDYRNTLANVIRMNTGINGGPDNVFKAQSAD